MAGWEYGPEATNKLDTVHTICIWQKYTGSFAWSGFWNLGNQFEKIVVTYELTISNLRTRSVLSMQTV